MGNKMKSDDGFDITVRESAERSEYVGQRLPELNQAVEGAGSHRTSPFVFSGCAGQKKVYVGGASEFLAHVAEVYPQFK